jgi:hypothetical protein
MHIRFVNNTKEKYVLHILEIMELNDDTCSISELKGYDIKELKNILRRLKINYRNISKRNNPMYFTLY